jgi:NitT/TauT family transport system permease protein
VIARLWPPALGVVVIALAWHVMATATHSPLVPSLAEIAAELARLARSGALVPQLAVTVERVVLGFSLAFALAVVFGIAMGRSTLIRRVCEPAVLIGLTVPGLVCGRCSASSGSACRSRIRSSPLPRVRHPQSR